MLGRHHDLVEIKRARIDRDEADHHAVGLGDHDFGDRQKLVAPALAPPVEPLGKIKFRISLLPGPQPKCYGGVLIARLVTTQRNAGAVCHGNEGGRRAPCRM